MKFLKTASSALAIVFLLGTSDSNAILLRQMEAAKPLAKKTEGTKNMV